jgi:hypothetical protein
MNNQVEDGGEVLPPNERNQFKSAINESVPNGMQSRFTFSGERPLKKRL